MCVQLVGFDGGAHSSHGATFTIITLIEGRPGVVYVEGLTASDYLGREHVRVYNLAFENLRATTLSQQRTMEDQPTDHRAGVGGRTMITPDLTNARWRTSSRSGGGQGCVEVARSATRAAIRDTKNRDGATLTVNAEMFDAFLTTIRTNPA